MSGGRVRAAERTDAVRVDNTRRLLEALSDMLTVPATKARMADRVNSRLRLEVGGKSRLVLNLRADTPAHVGACEGDTKSEVDAVLLLSDADFALLCAGELSPDRAFMTGRLVIRGNLLRAMSCGPIFELLRPPLPTPLAPSAGKTAPTTPTKTPRPRPRRPQSQPSPPPPPPPRPPRATIKAPMARL